MGFYSSCFTGVPSLQTKPIGVILTPFKSSEGMPIQSSFSDVGGEAVLEHEYSPGLESLDGFSHVILLYWFHKSKHFSLKVKPYLDQRERGVFSTRAPSRPNPIGLSIVELIRVESNRVIFRGADMIDSSPLIDIKPFVPEFDNRPNAVSGWLEDPLGNGNTSTRADSRFHE